MSSKEKEDLRRLQTSSGGLENVFWKTSSQRLENRSLRLPFQTNLRRLWDKNWRRIKTSSRRFLVKAEDHLKTIYGLPIYVRFKLQTYSYSITRQSKCLSITKLINYINLDKLNTLKYGKNLEIVKTWFSMKYFFSIGILNIHIVVKPVIPEVWKTFPKRLL